MKKQLEKYFGCKVKIAEYKNKLPLPIFMTMRDIMTVSYTHLVQKKKMQKQSLCIYGAQTCMKNMHHTSRNSSRISRLNLL